MGDDKAKPVILDTNALMMQFQFYIDVESELQRILNFPFRVVVPSSVIDELDKLASSGTPKEKGEATMAAELAKTFDVRDSEGDADSAIVKLAEELEAIVVTNDKLLRARLRAKGIPNVHMRSKAFLTVEGYGGL